MKNMKSINLKNMKETLVNYSGLQDEMDKIWDTFYQMATLEFINPELWRKFYDECSGWYIDNDRVLDGHRGDKLVWQYTGEADYKA